MSQYKYDEQGDQFYVFLLSVFVLVLAPLTYHWATGGSAEKTSKAPSCNCDACVQKSKRLAKRNRRSLRNPKIGKQTVIVALGWACVAFLGHRVAQTSSVATAKLYDPFDILGIAASATEKEIKRHYRKLTVKFHPDKITLGPNQTKEEVDNHFVELTKAYKALTDETIRKNFELYGHPDGRQEMNMGIALPKWIVESQNNIWVLGMYAIVFGLGLPYLVGRWWYGSRRLTKDQLLNTTAFTYFQTLREDTSFPRLVEILAASDEFADPKLNKRSWKSVRKEIPELDRLETEVRAVLNGWGNKWALTTKFESVSARMITVLLYAHMLRIETSSVPMSRAMVRSAARAVHLLPGLLAMALAHNWLSCSLTIMALSQHLIQGTHPAFPSVAELLQLPGLKRIQAERLTRGGVGDRGIEGLVALAEDKRRETIGDGKDGELVGSEEEQMMKVAREWPRLELVEAFFKVTGERLVTTGSLVNFVLKVRVCPPGESTPPKMLVHGVPPSMLETKGENDADALLKSDEEGEVELDELIGRKKGGQAGASGDEDGEGQRPQGWAHAPRFIENRKAQWWIMIGDTKLNRVIVQPARMTDVGVGSERTASGASGGDGKDEDEDMRTFSIQFQAPPQAGLYTFQAFVVSDTYHGTDIQKNLMLKVEDPSVLEGEGEDEDEDDDISDPEEDTLAGQMAQMRGERVKSSTGNGDGDEEEEEEEWSEEGEEESGTDDDVEEEDEESSSDSD